MRIEMTPLGSVAEMLRLTAVSFVASVGGLLLMAIVPTGPVESAAAGERDKVVHVELGGLVGRLDDEAAGLVEDLLGRRGVLDVVVGGTVDEGRALAGRREGEGAATGQRGDLVPDVLVAVVLFIITKTAPAPPLNSVSMATCARTFAEVTSETPVWLRFRRSFA